MDRMRDYTDLGKRADDEIFFSKLKRARVTLERLALRINPNDDSKENLVYVGKVLVACDNNQEIKNENPTEFSEVFLSGVQSDFYRVLNKSLNGPETERSLSGFYGKILRGATEELTSDEIDIASKIVSNLSNIYSDRLHPKKTRSLIW